MADEREQAMQLWAEDHQARRGLIEGLDAAALDRPTDNPGWTVRDLAAHVASSDEMVLMCAKRLAQGKNVLPVPMPGRVFEWMGSRMNGRTVRRHRRDNVTQLVGHLEATHGKAADFLATIPAEGFSRAGTVPSMGRMTLAEVLSTVVEHNREHAAVLRKALV